MSDKKKKKVKLKKPTPLGIIGRGLKKGLKKSIGNTPDKNKRRLNVIRSREDRLANNKPSTTTMSKAEIRRRRDKNAGWRKMKPGSKAQIMAFAKVNGKAETIKKFGNDAVDKIVASMPKKKLVNKKTSPKITADLQPSGHPMTGELGGRGGLSFKAGGKIISREKGGPAKTKLKKPTPLGIMGRGLKKGLKRVLKDKTSKLVKEIKTTPRDIMPRPKKGSGKLNEKGVRTGGIINFKSQKVKQAPKGGSKTATGKPLKGGQIATGGKQKNVVGEGVGRKAAGVTSIKKAAGTGKGPTKVTKGGQLKTKKAEKTISKNQSRARKQARRTAIKRGLLATGIGYGIYEGTKGAGPKTPMAGTDTSSSGGKYKVKKGDTLSQIAKRHGTTLSALLKKNNIALKDANKLGIGDSLKLPAKVKDRKSVYQGMKKSEMKKMVMPKKKKMGGGKVYRRGGGKALRGFGNATYSNKMY